MKKTYVLAPAVLAAMVAVNPALAQNAAPAAPEALTCGIYSSTGWFGESAEGSDLSTSDAALNQTLNLPAGKKAVLAFKVGAAGSGMRIELAPQDSSDPTLQILNASGELVGSNDDYGSGLGSRVEADLAAGNYCAVIEEVNNAAMVVNARASRYDQPALIADGGGETSSTIAACTSTTEAQPFSEAALSAAVSSGRVNLGVQVPGTKYLRLELAEPTPLVFRATANGPDPQIALFDGTGSLIAQNDDAEDLNSRLDFPDALAAGTYCLGVSSVNDAPGRIDVSAEKLDRASYLRAAFERGEIPPTAGSGFTAEPLDLKSTQPTVALLGNAAAWYELNVEEETVLIVNAYGQMAGIDTKLRLFGPNGQMIEEIDDVEGSTDARIGPRLFQPGRYSVALMKVGSSDGGVGATRPVMISTERFVRAK